MKLADVLEKINIRDGFRSYGMGKICLSGKNGLHGEKFYTTWDKLFFRGK